MPDGPTGTVVFWKNLDRVCDDKSDSCDAESVFLQKFTEVKSYLEMVFHQFLEGRSPLKIRIGEGDCIAWNPYLTSNNFHQELSAEKYEDSRVKVVPYILPHVSKRTPEENALGAGLGLEWAAGLLCLPKQEDDRFGRISGFRSQGGRALQACTDKGRNQ